MVSHRLVENPPCRRWQIIRDRGLGQLAGRGAFDLRPVPGPHQDAFPDSGIPAALEVREFVADHVAAREVQAEFVAGVEQELR